MSEQREYSLEDFITTDDLWSMLCAGLNIPEPPDINYWNYWKDPETGNWFKTQLILPPDLEECYQQTGSVSLSAEEGAQYTYLVQATAEMQAWLDCRSELCKYAYKSRDSYWMPRGTDPIKLPAYALLHVNWPQGGIPYEPIHTHVSAPGWMGNLGYLLFLKKDADLCVRELTVRASSLYDARQRDMG